MIFYKFIILKYHLEIQQRLQKKMEKEREQAKQGAQIERILVGLLHKVRPDKLKKLTWNSLTNCSMHQISLKKKKLLKLFLICHWCQRISVNAQTKYINIKQTVKFPSSSAQGYLFDIFLQDNAHHHGIL